MNTVPDTNPALTCTGLGVVAAVVVVASVVVVEVLYFIGIKLKGLKTAIWQKFD